ncbi:MAG: hypothetical protein K0R59_2703 [Sphingobacterium sp.]|jgi:hypothetical protein|nr:hypothetical protein [Sphingobacterium sp.]
MALFYDEASSHWDHVIIPHSPQNKPFRNERLVSLYSDSNQKRWPEFELFYR